MYTCSTLYLNSSNYEVLLVQLCLSLFRTFHKIVLTRRENCIASKESSLEGNSLKLRLCAFIWFSFLKETTRPVAWIWRSSCTASHRRFCAFSLTPSTTLGMQVSTVYLSLSAWRGLAIRKSLHSCTNSVTFFGLFLVWNGNSYFLW